MNLILSKFLGQDKKLLIKVIAGVILFVIAFAFYFMKENAADNGIELSVVSDSGIELEHGTTESAAEEKCMIIVDVAGAVTNPSVVTLPEGSRVYEAIEKAGGLSQEADISGTNRAEVLTDGQKIYIPTKQELSALQQESGALSFYSHQAPSVSTLVNINTADSETLQQLTGVGPATAEKIINYRNTNGKFKNIDEIKNVSGIGEKTFEKFKSKITV